MTMNRWKYWRWSPRGAYIGFMYAIFVPSVMGYMFWKTDVRYAFLTFLYLPERNPT